MAGSIPKLDFSSASVMPDRAMMVDSGEITPKPTGASNSPTLWPVIASTPFITTIRPTAVVSNFPVKEKWPFASVCAVT